MAHLYLPFVLSFILPFCITLLYCRLPIHITFLLPFHIARCPLALPAARQARAPRPSLRDAHRSINSLYTTHISTTRAPERPRNTPPPRRHTPSRRPRTAAGEQARIPAPPPRTGQTAVSGAPPRPP
ncbi:hypothetical protein METBIDRAFT_153484 [Metschnikowia bicuspidata var. bicuspidata NRRL YB-4993]|uniref:Uncharacterized protein n=1 Tax=Metschnikowia bicuspidata var. bicuspidata NRRL YB-4993 TaxID=869754 RepID=A0A1A0HEU8_9ASCO|nr:hypothetical protein METBIDRAFT_153484 [Metschnikowia bicuspidata var. bicuspidata NRRL YB-4993]OBA22433.1 hypothetical protein METBIDRAFT_153484 [Metschnikowia bicuspidata var. bicuspidata NRRL YB-4993]